MGRTNRSRGDYNSATIGVIRDNMAEKGTTHENVSESANIPRSSITKILNGNMALTLDNLFSICDALEIKASTVIAEVECRLKARKGRTHTPNTVEQPSLSHLLSLAADEREISVEDDDEAAAWTP